MRRLTSLLAVEQRPDDALVRAESLLADSLTSEQYTSYLARGYVEVASRIHHGRTYRVDGWRPVAVYEGGQFVGAVCIRAKEPLPGPDVLLARKLMIEGAEDEFLHAGNWLHPAWRPAGAAPTIFLILALVSPYLVHLRMLGPWGLIVGALIALSPAVFMLGRRRRVTTFSRAAGSDDPRGTQPAS